MRRLYQKEWHGIQFNEFANLSSKKLADGHFYEKFYKEFFDRFKTWDDIHQGWRDEKKIVADFLYRLILNGQTDGGINLSVGCGIGYIEHELIRAGIDPAYLEVSDIAETPFRWLRLDLPEKNIHLGLIPDCLPAERKYSLIYLVAVDYSMDQDKFITFLWNFRCKLEAGGRCIVVTASYDGIRRLSKIKRRMKDSIKHLLDAVRLRPLGQFWGYSRNRDEFQFAMKAAGFLEIRDGFIGPSTDFIYWISGSVSPISHTR